MLLDWIWKLISVPGASVVLAALIGLRLARRESGRADSPLAELREHASCPPQNSCGHRRALWSHKAPPPLSPCRQTDCSPGVLLPREGGCGCEQGKRLRRSTMPFAVEGREPHVEEQARGGEVMADCKMLPRGWAAAASQP